jgi:hypothetical protein
VELDVEGLAPAVVALEGRRDVEVVQAAVDPRPVRKLGVETEPGVDAAGDPLDQRRDDRANLALAGALKAIRSSEVVASAACTQYAVTLPSRRGTASTVVSGTTTPRSARRET